MSMKYSNFVVRPIEVYVQPVCCRQIFLSQYYSMFNTMPMSMPVPMPAVFPKCLFI